MRHHTRRFLAALGMTAALTSAPSAQSLESRVASAGGTIGFTYETKSNVCGDGASITVSDDSSPGWTVRSLRSGIHIGIRRGDRYERCDQGPARVVLRRDGPSVVDLRVFVGGLPQRVDTDLGEVRAADAASYLLALAPRLAGKSADNAVLGAEIADGTVVWPTLLRIARDNEASESSRKASMFWLSHAAGIAATAGLDSIATDDDAMLSVRADAVFFLAQRPNGEGIPALVRVVETSKSMKLRKDAIFFLAQSRDTRALALFEKLLAGK